MAKLFVFLLIFYQDFSFLESIKNAIKYVIPSNTEISQVLLYVWFAWIIISLIIKLIKRESRIQNKNKIFVKNQDDKFLKLIIKFLFLTPFAIAAFLVYAYFEKKTIVLFFLILFLVDYIFSIFDKRESCEIEKNNSLIKITNGNMIYELEPSKIELISVYNTKMAIFNYEKDFDFIKDLHIDEKAYQKIYTFTNGIIPVFKSDLFKDDFK